MNWDNPELVKRAERIAASYSQETLYRITMDEHDQLCEEIRLNHGLDLNDLWKEYWRKTDEGPDSSSRKGITARFNYFWDCMRALNTM